MLDPRPRGVKLSLTIPALMLLFAVGAALLAALLAGCSAPRPGSDRAAGTDLARATFEGERQVRVRFSRPIVAARRVGAPLDQAPLVIHPPVPLAARWIDRQTLLARPLAPLRPSTRYRVALAAGLSDLVGHEATYSFVHRPLRVTRLSWQPAAAARQRLILHFNQPVEADLAARRCVLRQREAPGRTLPLDSPDAGLALRDVRLTARAPRLARGTYELRCQRLVGAGGDAPMTEPYTALLRVEQAAAGLPRRGGPIITT